MRRTRFAACLCAAAATAALVAPRPLVAQDDVEAGVVPSFEATAARVLPLPPARPVYAPSGGRRAPSARLVKVSERRNEITDEGEWFARNRIESPESTSLAAQMPQTYGGRSMVRALRAPGANVLLYGSGYEASVVAVQDPATLGLCYALDFSGYKVRRTSGSEAGRQATLAPVWAWDAGGTLYVENSAGGYAREVGGRTGYLSAFDGKNGCLLWRSGPLVANAKTFAVLAEVIVSGYGFTAEKDFVFVLDRRTGRVLQKVPVRSGPEHILAKGDRVYVRCYDTDYVFRVTDR